MDDADQRRIAAGDEIDLKWLRSFVVVPVKQSDEVTWTAEAYADRQASGTPPRPRSRRPQAGTARCR